MTGTWDLTKIYSSKEDIDKDIALIAEGNINMDFTDVESLVKCLEEVEHLLIRREVLLTYATLDSLVNLNDTEKASFQKKANELAYALNKDLSDFELRIHDFQFSDEDLNKLGKYKDYIIQLKKQPRVTKEEFSIVSEVEGLGDINRDIFNSLMYSDNFGKRDSSREARLYKLRTIENALMSNFRGSIFRHNWKSNKLHFKNSFEQTLWEDGIPRGVYDKLIENVCLNSDVAQDIIKYISGDSSVNESNYATVSTVPKIPFNVTFDKVIDDTLESSRQISEEYYSRLKEYLSNDVIDAYPRMFKRGGSFSAFTYGCTPYIMSNFVGHLFDSIISVPHEIAHSMHTIYSRENNSFFTSHPSKLYAEIVSSVGELLFIEHMRKTSDNYDFCKKHFLSLVMRNIFTEATIADTHREMIESDYPSLDKLREFYGSIRKRIFGDNVKFHELSYLNFLSEPSIYNGVYDYQYIFGRLVSFVIFKNLDKIDYTEFLKTGSSISVYESLQNIGIDINSKEFYNEAFSSIKEFIFS